MIIIIARLPIAQTANLEGDNLTSFERWVPKALIDEIKMLQKLRDNAAFNGHMYRFLWGGDTYLYHGFQSQMIETARIRNAALSVAEKLSNGENVNAKQAWEKLAKLTDLSNSSEDDPAYSVHLMRLINAVLNSRKGLSSLPKGSDSKERKGTAAAERKRLADDLRELAGRLENYPICASLFDAFTHSEIEGLAKHLTGNAVQNQIDYNTDFIISIPAPTLPNLLLRLASNLNGKELNDRKGDPFLFKYGAKDFVGVDSTRGLGFEELARALTNEFNSKFNKPLHEVTADLCGVFYPGKVIDAKSISRLFKKSTTKIG